MIGHTGASRANQAQAHGCARCRRRRVGTLSHCAFCQFVSDVYGDHAATCPRAACGTQALTNIRRLLPCSQGGRCSNGEVNPDPGTGGGGKGHRHPGCRRLGFCLHTRCGPELTVRNPAHARYLGISNIDHGHTATQAGLGTVGTYPPPQGVIITPLAVEAWGSTGNRQRRGSMP